MLSTDKGIKLLLLLVYVVFSSLVAIFLNPIYLVTVLLVIGVPSAVNYLWLKRSRKKILVFSLATTLLFAPAVELAARSANLWDVQTIFFRPFGLIPLENILFAFLNFFWVLSFYEYFIDKDVRKKISPKFRYLLSLFAVFSLLVFSLFLHNPSLVSFGYIAISIPILIIPASILFYRRPHLLGKTALPTVFFFFVFFLYEMAAIHIGNWWWPGEYWFPIDINGHVFPVDDVIVWYILSTPALIGGYEFFTDDYR